MAKKTLRGLVSDLTATQRSTGAPEAIAATVPLAYLFEAPPTGGPDEHRRVLGSKGAGLVAMTAAGLPVPPGFTLTTSMCRRYFESGWEPAFDDVIRHHVERLEIRSDRRLGDPESPLLVSVRSGAATSMPGMMDTVLDVGMNPDVQSAIVRSTGDARFAADTRRRALLGFAAVVLGAPPDVVARAAAHDDPGEIDAVLAAAGYAVPADPFVQVVAAVRAVFDSWNSPRAVRYREIEGIDPTAGTAATVQTMVFGNRSERSGTGVAFTRDPATGAPGLMGDFLPDAQGEDVVAGERATLPLSAMRESWPDQYAELERIAGVLERSMGDMVDLEFTVEDGTLWMLQARRAKRSPLATFRAAVDMADDPDFPVDRAEAVRRCARHLADPPTVGDAAGTDEGRRSVGHAAAVVATGLPASPGRAAGVLCTDVDEAVRHHDEGRPVVLVRRETSPADVHGMAASVAIFTLSGGLVSHAAVVARDWGLPAVVGASDASITDDGLVGPGGLAAIGATVTVDGDRGALLLGDLSAGGTPAPEALTVLRWADELGWEAPSEPAESSGVESAPGHGLDGTTAGDVDEDLSFPVLHALRIRGMADAPAVASMTGLPDEQVATALAALASHDLAAHVESRDLWRLTDPGRTTHAGVIDALRSTLDLEALPYQHFLRLDDQFKALCSDWQIRDGRPNDHTDPIHDAAIVARLADVDDAVQVVLPDIAAVLPWTAPYAGRLAAARRRAVAGDPRALTGVLCDSYHDIWMELHEDLILVQGIDRAEEGSG